MSRSIALTVLALLITAPAVAGPNPGITAGYAGTPDSATVDNGGVAVYRFIVDVDAPDGQSVVHLEFDFLAGDGRIQPASTISMRQGGGPFSEVGNLQGPTQVLRRAYLAEGRYLVEVESSVLVPEAGEYTSALRIIARDATTTSSAPGIVLPFHFTVTAPSSPPPSEVPAAVTGLRSSQTNATAAHISWSPADRAASYEVHRSQTPGFAPSQFTLVATRGQPGFQDGDLEPGTTYYYRVLGLGASGEEGPASAALEVRTTPAAPAGPPAIFGLRVSVGDTVKLTWNTDQPATASLSGLGPAVRSEEATAFEADVGLLAPGRHAYRIEATSAAGATVVLEGSFLLQDGERSTKTPVPARIVEDLDSLGVEVDPQGVYLVDDRADGSFDRLEDVDAVLDTRHAIPSRSLILAEGLDGLALIDALRERAHAVAALDGLVVDAADGAAAAQATVRVESKEGWILVSVADPFPGREITGFARTDRSLSVEMVWREGGSLVFLDDPEQEYTISFAGAPAPDTESSQEAPRSLAALWWILGVLAAAAVAVAVVLSRRR